MDISIEPGFKGRVIDYAAIRPGRRKTRVIVERGLLFALASVVALVGVKGIGVGLSAIFAGVALSL